MAETFGNRRKAYQRARVTSEQDIKHLADAYTTEIQQQTRSDHKGPFLACEAKYTLGLFYRMDSRRIHEIILMIPNAFTCTGSYAIMILYGIKRTENRSACPEPREGRAAISCSKSFCKEEFGHLIAWASVNLPSEDFEKLPSWREVKDWPGKIIAVCDYKARDGLNLVLEDGVYKSKPTPKQEWDEGYRYWWDLSNVRRLSEPIPCRGNVGMWQLSESLAAEVSTAHYIS